MENPFGPFYSFQTFFLIICAAAYYKAAELEKASGILWTGMSVLVFLLTWLGFGWDFPGNLLGQVALLGGITLARVLRDARQDA
jgi:hypothetical protein